MGLAYLENLVPIFETMGRHLVSSPLMASSIASELISSYADEKKKRLACRVASGEPATLGLYEENGPGHSVIPEQSPEKRLRDFWKKCFVTDVDVALFY